MWDYPQSGSIIKEVHLNIVNPPKTSTLLQAIQPSALFYSIYNMCVCMVYQRILFLFVKNEEYQCLFYFPE